MLVKDFSWEYEMMDGITDSVGMNLRRLQELVKDRESGVLQSMGSQRVRHNLVTEQQQTLSSKHPHLCSTPCLQDGNGDTLCPSCP